MSVDFYPKLPLPERAPPICPDCREDLVEVTGAPHRGVGLSIWECDCCQARYQTIQREPEISDQPDLPLPARRTAAPPGSEEKIEVMAARREAGRAVFHPDDNPAPEHAPEAQVGGQARAEHPGVTWDARRQRWRARVTVDGRRVYLGLFVDYASAVEATRAARDSEGNVVSRRQGKGGRGQAQ